MNIGRITFMSLVLAIASTSASRAQEPGRVGVLLGFPVSIGIVWHISDGFGLRPEISWWMDSADSSFFSQEPWRRDSWHASVGLSALFSVHHWGPLHAYVSPGFAYLKTSSKWSTGPTWQTWDTTGYLVMGSLGAQYSIAEHFALFAETDLSYQNTTYSSDTRIGSEDRHGAGTRGAVGAILYF